MEAWPCSGGIPLNLPESIPHNYKAQKVKAGAFFCRGYRDSSRQRGQWYSNSRTKQNPDTGLS